MLGRRLMKGDTIGIISPSGPESPEKITKGIKFLSSLGFNVKLGKHIYKRNGYLAGNDNERVEDLINMFLDKEVHMILCIRGGYGAMRILPLIDFEIIKNNPKIFAGYSDITTLLNSIYAKTNLITFHAPMLSSDFNKTTCESFFQTLMNGFKEYEIKNPNNIQLKSAIDGVCTGELVGGNLCLISSTLGTPYEIDTKNKILFIEEVSEEPYRIDRMLTQLLLAGKLQECSGFILGQFKDCDVRNFSKSLPLNEVISDRILSLNKPTLFDLCSGHDNPKLTVPIGAKIELNCYNKTIKILESVVS